MEIKLNGVNAVVALVVLGGFAAYRMSTMQTTLETDALQELKAYLAAEYAGPGVANLSAVLESNQPMSDELAAADAQAILDTQNITFPSVSARGLWKGGGDVIAKVEIQVNGGPPPDGDPIRYYRMQYRTVSGWDVQGRTSVWSYRLKLF